MRKYTCLASLLVLFACENDPPPTGEPIDRLRELAPQTTTEGDSTGTHVSTSVFVAGATPSERAANFIAEFGTALLDDPDRLEESEVREDDDGGAVVVYDVNHDGRRVYGAEVRVAVDADGNVRYAGGSYPEDYDDLGTVGISPDEARAIMRAAFPRSFLRGEPELVVFNPGIFYGTRTPSHLAYIVEAIGFGAGGSVRAFIDAQHGYMIVGMPRSHTGRDRQVFNWNGVVWDETTTGDEAQLEYDESGAQVAMPRADSTAVYGHAGTVYDFFNDNFERDSLDDAGMTLTFYVELPEAIMGGANAYWDGSQSLMMFTPGLANSLDVTAHELTHGVVEHTAGLEYWMEAGALNESMADVFASYIDTATPYTIGDGATNLGVIRSLSDPMAFGNPHHVDLAYAPPVRGSCAGDITACDETFERCVGGQCMLDDGFSDHGGVHVNSSIPNHVVYLFTEGGTHAVSGISITAIGRDRSMHVVYGALTKYLGTSSGFSDYRVAARQAALDIIEGTTEGPDMDYEHCGAILNAFSSAGIGETDEDNDCFDDAIDNCPCLYNPEQNPDDCEMGGDQECLEPECESEMDCMEGSCSTAGNCVEFTPPAWDCSGPGDCTVGHCNVFRECADPCTWRDCGGCLLDSRCSWCGDTNGGCVSDATSCTDGTTETACDGGCEAIMGCGACQAAGCGWCEASGTCAATDSVGTCADGFATECSDPCEGAADNCGECNQITGCGWCPGVGCTSNANEASCMDWRDSQSQCPDCTGYTDCGTCAADGFCAWCPSMGCVNDSLTMCDDKRPNPSDCS